MPQTTFNEKTNWSNNLPGFSMGSINAQADAVVYNAIVPAQCTLSPDGASMGFILYGEPYTQPSPYSFS